MPARPEADSSGIEEIEITPKMIEAGADVLLWRADSADRHRTVMAILEAMAAVSGPPGFRLRKTCF